MTEPNPTTRGPGPRSRYLGRLALRGLSRAGNTCLPGNGTYPSFDDLGCVGYVDRVLEHVVEADRRALRVLLGLLSLLPTAVHRRLLSRAAASFDRDGLTAPLLRQIDYGVTGLVKSLYFSGWSGSGYSGPNPVEVMGYSFPTSEEDLVVIGDQESLPLARSEFVQNVVDGGA